MDIDPQPEPNIVVVDDNGSMAEKNENNMTGGSQAFANIIDVKKINRRSVYHPRNKYASQVHETGNERDAKIISVNTIQPYQ